jgi:hypothetical protein
MIFLTFLPSALVVMMVCSVVMGASSVEVAGSRDVSGVASAVWAGGDCTSAIMCGVGRVRWTAGVMVLHELLDSVEAFEVALVVSRT